MAVVALGYATDAAAAVRRPVLRRRAAAGRRVSFEGDEVAGHTWLTPEAALRRDGRRRDRDVAADERHAPAARACAHRSTTIRDAPGAGSARRDRGRHDRHRRCSRIVMPAGGGVAGQPVCAYLVGRRRFVLVDPGDPTGPALDRALALVAERGGSIVAIALTHADPDHAGGAEAMAEIAGMRRCLAGRAPGGSCRMRFVSLPTWSGRRSRGCATPRGPYAWAAPGSPCVRCRRRDCAGHGRPGRRPRRSARREDDRRANRRSGIDAVPRSAPRARAGGGLAGRSPSGGCGRLTDACATETRASRRPRPGPREAPQRGCAGS